MSIAVRPNITVVCVVVFSMCTVCTFVGGMIPQSVSTASFGLIVGTLSGGAMMLVLALIHFISKKKLTIFQLAPWVIIVAMSAFALYLYGPETYEEACVIVLGCPLVFQVMLVVYFGKLATKGYFAPSLMFALSLLCSQIGVAAGDVLSLIVETLPAPTLESTATVISFAFMLFQAALIILLTRQEFLLERLMSDPVPREKAELICEEMAAEFKLSPRETEILRLLAQGASTNKIAEKFFISPNTVNTHIRHIYEKTSIHSRAELIDYVNMRNDKTRREGRVRRRIKAKGRTGRAPKPSYLKRELPAAANPRRGVSYLGRRLSTHLRTRSALNDLYALNTARIDIVQNARNVTRPKTPFLRA